MPEDKRVRRRPEDVLRAIEALNTAETENFVELFEIAGLSPSNDLVGADLSGVDLRGLERIRLNPDRIQRLRSSSGIRLA